MKTASRTLSPLRSLTAASALLAAGCSLVGIRSAEEASYRVIREDGDFELREYDGLIVAETFVDAAFDDAGGIGFRRLFGYISGDNATESKIAMTSPVLADSASPPPPEGRQTAPTSPVLEERRVDGWRYVFVLPTAYTLDQAPAPTNPDVRLASVPPSRVAALRYSGSWSEDIFRAKSEELLAWIQANDLLATSKPRSAGYDPPWTIPFLRRNEVLIDVD